MRKLSRKEFIIAASSFAAMAFVAPKIFFKFLSKEKILPEDLAPGAGNFKSIYLDDKKRSEFKFGTPSAYVKAVQTKILDKVCSHMK